MSYQIGCIHFKAAENAHGTNGEVTFNFITRRRYSDTGVKGAQLDEAYIFEGIGRIGQTYLAMQNNYFVSKYIKQ